MTFIIGENDSIENERYQFKGDSNLWYPEFDE